MDNFLKAINALEEEKNIKIEPGLNKGEISEIEKIYSIKFHPDHKKLIQAGVILGKNGHNWRDFSQENTTKIQNALSWPLDGILFDIEFDNFWLDEIGEKPKNLLEAKEKFTDWYQNNVPQLIPIYGHRYMCSVPIQDGAPIYSVHQTDIIYYGKNIFEYLDKEFKENLNIKYPKWKKDNTPFWSTMVT